VYFSKSLQMSVPAHGSALPEPVCEPPPALTTTPPLPALAELPPFPGLPPTAAPPFAAPAALAPEPPGFVPPVVPLPPEPPLAGLPATLLAPAGPPFDELELTSQPASSARDARDQTRNRGAVRRARRAARRKRIRKLYYVLAGVRCHWNRFRNLSEISRKIEANRELSSTDFAGNRHTLVTDFVRGSPWCPVHRQKIPMCEKS